MKETEDEPRSPLAGTLPQVRRQTYCSGLSDAVAAAEGLKRITPVWSAKKYRLPVCPGVAGLATTTNPVLLPLFVIGLYENQ